MKSGVYSIFDSAVQAFMQPYVAQTDGQAIRAFQDTANDEKTSVNKHPDQYTLFRIAEFDDSDGQMTPLIPVKSLGTAIQYIIPKVDRESLVEMYDLIKEVRKYLEDKNQ